MRETALSCRASSVGGARPHSQRSLPRLTNITLSNHSVRDMQFWFWLNTQVMVWEEVHYFDYDLTKRARRLSNITLKSWCEKKYTILIVVEQGGPEKVSGAVAGVEGVHQAVLLPGEKFLCTSLKFGTLDSISSSSLLQGTMFGSTTRMGRVWSSSRPRWTPSTISGQVLGGEGLGWEKLDWAILKKISLAINNEGAVRCGPL